MTTPHRRPLAVSLLVSVTVLLWVLPIRGQASLDDLRTRVEQGDAEAQFALGGLYANPDGPVTRDTVEATRLFRLAAEQGHAGAQLTLALFYLVGEGVPQTPVEAERWFRKAAEQGDALAQHNLGHIYQGVPAPYRTDQDVPLDHAEAVRWFRRAAEQGHVSAASSLAIKYRDGNGIMQDLAEAFRWFLRAAELGDVTAMGETGAMLAAGRGVARDDISAYMWLDVAAMQAGGEDREMLLIDREAVAERMNAEQFAEAQRRVDAWTPRQP